VVLVLDGHLEPRFGRLVQGAGGRWIARVHRDLAPRGRCGEVVVGRQEVEQLLLGLVVTVG
jgi:hypothetical protein